MTGSLDEIERKLCSECEPVLTQALQFALRCREREMTRGQRAETRATAMLGILGLIATLAVAQANVLVDVQGGRLALLGVIYLASLAFVVRGLYFAMGVLRGRMVNQINLESVFDFGGLNSKDALRKETAWLIWETRELRQPNNAKLWRLDRCQRSGFVAVILLGLFGLVLFAVKKGGWDISGCWSVVFGVVALLVWFFEKNLFNAIPWSRG